MPTNKRYSGDNRLIILKRLYRRDCLAPRCRLIHPGTRSGSKGSVVHRSKVVRELGSERARQFGPYYYSSRIREMFSLVREDWIDSIIVFGLFKKQACSPHTLLLIAECK